MEIKKESNFDCIKFEYNEKLNILKDIAHQIKKKRFILDENVEKFGFDEMSLLCTVKNIDEVKGYPFVCSKLVSKILKGIKLGIKIIPIEVKYPKDEHPSLLEFIALKELTKELISNNITPHIVYYLYHQKVTNKCKALKFLNLKRLEVEELVRTHSNMLISEFIEGNSLDNWVYDIYENDNKIEDDEWLIIIFQIIYTLCIFQKKYKLMHNDMHYGNILMDTSLKKIDNQYFVYKIKNKTFYIPNRGFLPKVWDLEFSMSYSTKIPDYYPNKFILAKYDHDKKTHITKEPDNESDESTEFNVPYNYNETYDLHYFLTSLLDLYISDELYNFIVKIYPDELIPREENSTSSSSNSYSSTDSSSESSLDAENLDELNVKLDKLEFNEEINEEINEDNEKLSPPKPKKSDDLSKLHKLDISTDSDDSDSDDSDNSDSSDDSVSDYSSESSIYDRYLCDGRMRNGIEKEFEDLPTPMIIIDNPIFEKFTKKPSDFDESKAIYFNAGF